MRRNPGRFFIFFGVSCMAALGAQLAFAQSGGAYQITQSVTANGGETSSGGNFSIQDTSGQPVAGGLLQNSSYSIYSGFWTPANFAPTAATVTVAGRVTTANGQGISNAVITLTDMNGIIRTAKTAGFGYYQFADILAGRSYLITISSKRFTFSNPTRVLNVLEELSEVDFIAEN